MRWSEVTLLGAVLASAAAGCRNNDLVEAELRARQSAFNQLHADFAGLKAQNEALMLELRSVHQGGPVLGAEPASQTYALKQITLGRGTGGYDEDGYPGDEALQVVVEPRDADGHALKVPGTLHIETFEISREGLKIPFCIWDLDADQLRRTWKSGFLMTGYVVVLPWKSWPNSDRLRVVARLALLDGRVFEADKDVVIHLAPVGPRPAPASDNPGPAIFEPGAWNAPRLVDPTTMSASRGWWDAAPVQRAADVQPTPTWQPKQVSILDSIKLAAPEPLNSP